MVSDEVRPVEEYAKRKVECEKMIRESGLDWAILRLGAALPIRLILDRGMFEVPLDNRIEYLHGKDAGLAFANAVRSKEVWGKTLLIGGGEGCQFIYGDLMDQILETTGVGSFPEEAFAQEAYSTDWLDTVESQALLGYQKRGLEDYLKELREKMGWRRGFVKLLRPIVRWMMLRQSPYFGLVSIIVKSESQ
jgi:nucleoside-diphosphate-sugar epimerase